MTKLKRNGIIFIIVGVFIPSVLYPFTSPTTNAALLQAAFRSRGVVYETRLNDLEIVFKKGNWIKDENSQGHYEGRIVVAYHHTLAIGLTIAFIGISMIALAGKNIKTHYD